MVTHDPLFQTSFSIIYSISISFIAIAIFLAMASHGSNVISGNSEIKRQMTRCSEKFIRLSPSLSAMQVFNFLFENVMKTDMVVTGGGIFVINHGLILTIASVMTTYSVLILQLDQT
ncbi:uncharacterized protein CEXT_64361 [Caerostris extrusa]|uniref:Gustatory receptor n=1 Tax=Caerostris extrusa TaxID=172846 RepID=A0AAV4PP97_CAEEX|nr:uncharacterized protein CEXT_64361 [Caerostris extrusa]